MRTNGQLGICVAMAFLVCAGWSSRGEAKNKVYLVNQVEVKGGLSKALADAATNQICADVNKSLKKVDVHCPDDVKALLKARSDMLAMGAEGNEQMLTQQAAALLQADYIISGTASKIGNTVMLQLKLFDSKAGRIAGRASVSVSQAEKLLAKIPDALIDLFKHQKKK